MANPQKEHGYTPVANEILEHVYRFDFNKTQQKIIMFVWRYTYGFDRKAAEISTKFLADGTGSDQRNIQRELNRLIVMGVLTVEREACGVRPRKVGFNKNYEEWVASRGGAATTGGSANGEATNGDTAVSRGGGAATQDLQKTNIPPLPPTGGDVSGGLESVPKPKRGELTKAQEERFNRFWGVYPRKESKGSAKKAWAKIDPDEGLEQAILMAVDMAKVQDSRFRERQYTPLPASWLNSEGWLNEYGGGPVRQLKQVGNGAFEL